MKIAVITGASSGMGREFVYAFDKEEKFDELWVIARREDRLAELQGRCRARVRPIALDLGKRESFGEYKALLESEKPCLSTPRASAFSACLRRWTWTGNSTSSTSTPAR